LKVLVTGASGLLGSKLVQVLVEKGYDVIGLYNSHNPPKIEGARFYRLDISDTLRLEHLLLYEKPDVIVHAAAYTDVDGCEKNRELAWRVNVVATRSIVRISRVVNAYLVYISTDYVFDGAKGMYVENDTPNPINYYGLTKLVAEELVRASDILYVIVRPSAIYGIGGVKKSFAEYVAEKLSKGEEVKALVDQYVSPTNNVLLAQAISEIIERRPQGTLHVAGERMSRYEFALKIAEELGLPKELVKPARMEEMRKWIAKRPRDTSLDTSRARRLLSTRFYDTSLALRLFKEEWVAKSATA